MLLSYHQNAGQPQDIKIANRQFENVEQFLHLGTAVTIRNFILEEMKRRLNSVKAYNHSVQNILSLRPLFKNVQIIIYKKVKVKLSHNRLWRPIGL
jgi:hypothetical protein